MVTELVWDRGDSRGYINIAFDAIDDSLAYSAHVNTSVATLLNRWDATIPNTVAHAGLLLAVGSNVFSGLDNLDCNGGRCTSRARPNDAEPKRPAIRYRNGGADTINQSYLRAGPYYIAIRNDAVGVNDTAPFTDSASIDGTPYTPAADALGGANRPIVFPLPAQPLSVQTTQPSRNEVTLSWTRAMGSNETHYGILRSSTSTVDISGNAVSTLSLAEANCPAADTTRSCETTLSDLEPGSHHFRVLAINDSHSGAKTGRRGLETASAPVMVTVDAPPSPPASSSSSGGIIALALIGAGAYFWWKKRQIASGNAAKMALLPDVNFDLDRNDNRAFFTKMNWQNSGNSNWQLRGNANFHTKYSGKLLDWHANSHIGYRLNGKLGEFNPYLRGKFVQNAPENAEMEETYTLGVNYAIPNRIEVQFLQPDDQIWRYSIKTQLQLSPRLGLNFARPNSDLPDFSLGVKYQTPRGFSVSVTQPNSELNHYSLGIQWRSASRIRYEMSGNTSGRALKLRGSFSF